MNALATYQPRAAAYPYLEEVNEGVLREFRRRAAPPGRALDVGCGRGVLGQAVRNLGWEVWGIEQHAMACATARQRLDRVIEADLLDDDAVRQGVGPTRFDALIFSDVLEHLYDPLGAIENYAGYLRPGGQLFVSLPNAVVWTNRLSFLCGRVEYTDSGVMDRTHVRFFTFRSAKRLVREAGFRLERVSSTPHLARALLPVVKKCFGRRDDPRGLLNSPAYRAYLKWVYPVERTAAAVWPGLFAFRIILVATKSM